MGLLEFIILCVIVGLLVWAVNRFLPIPDQIKTLILIVAVIVLVVILLKAMGILGGDIMIPRVR
jgi:hypothetical protein